MKTLTIGRSSHCDIIIPHDSVSRTHARISIVGGKYVYEDISKHGSVIGGRYLQSGKTTIAPGTEVLLAGKVPLPWGKVYSMLPLKGLNAYDAETSCEEVGGYAAPHYDSRPSYNPGIGASWGILAFLIPLAGWIMYFCWKDDTPKRASQANTLAWISFAISFAFNILFFIAAAA